MLLLTVEVFVLPTIFFGRDRAPVVMPQRVAVGKLEEIIDLDLAYALRNCDKCQRSTC